MKKINLHIKIFVIVNIIFFTHVHAIFGQELSEDQIKKLYIKYGYALENPPFALRKDFFEETNSSWRYLSSGERKAYLLDWLSKNPDFDKSDVSLEEDDPALADLPSSLQRKYGIYLENAPYKARLDFLNSFEKNWNHTDYLEKKKFLQDWIKKNQINYEISEENISKDLRNILDEIHKKYGKTLYNAPFEARVEYFQTFNQSWRDIDYLDRKNFIIGWYQRNQEKLEKFKEQLRIELAENLDYQLNQMRIVDIEIPKSFGKELKDAPFELKRQYYVEMGETWTHAPVDMKELYTKKWLIENKDVYEKERNREREISNEQIRVIAEQEQNQEERDQYREEVLKRQKLRQKKEELRKKEEERRKKAFQKKVEAQRKKLENLIKNRNRR